MSKGPQQCYAKKGVMKCLRDKHHKGTHLGIDRDGKFKTWKEKK